MIFTQLRRAWPGRVLARVAGLIVLAGAASAAQAAAAVDDLTGPWQLLVDDYLVAARTNVARTYHPFQKHAGNPVLVADKPWEGTIVYIYGTVLPNEAHTGYRMWYHTMRTNDPDDTGDVQLYATSTDGINWTKPSLGLRSYDGSTSNNMYFTRAVKTGITSVMQTPDDPDPAQRYKFMSKANPGYWAAWSSNGVNVTDAPANPVFSGGSDVGQFCWDPHTERYLGYVKNGWTDANGNQRRAVALTTTTNVNYWPTESLILWPDAYDDRWAPAGTLQRTHFYGLSAFAYETMYIGFLWIFRATDAEGYYIGPVFAELVSSRDGTNWVREEGTRPAILPLGPAGAWDDGQLYTARAPVLDGDTLKLYYGGCDQVHGTATKLITCAIGLTTLRKDGFASLEAGATAGTILTKAFSGTGGPLRVNYQATGGGWLKVEVLDQNNAVVPGYSQAECGVLMSDSVNEVVTWATQPELPAGMPLLRLRFILQNASVYSFMAGDSAAVVDVPTITQQPADAFPGIGGTATFSIQAVGPGPLAYQWQKNGVNLSNGGHYAGSTTNRLTITGADSSDEAAYRCIVTNAYGSVTSSPATLTLITNVPTAPTANAATAVTDTSFTANWSSVSGAAGYRLDVSPNGAFSSYLSGYEDLEVGNVLTWSVTGLSPAITYYYRLRAYNGVGTSGNSDTISVTTTISPPPAPTALAASAVTSNSFTANWSSAAGAAGYRLDVSANNAFASYLSGYQDLDMGSATSRSVSGLSPSTTYYYRVRAYNGSGTSANSGTTNVTTASTVIPCVGIVNASFEGGDTSGVADGWIPYQRAPYPANTVWRIQTASPPTGGGQRYQEIANSSAAGGAGVRQDITGCVIGGTYTISGWMRGNSTANTTNRVKVSPTASSNWVTAIDLSPPQFYTGPNWTYFSGTVKATGTSMTIWLDGQTGGSGQFKAQCFDAITVACTDIPVPLRFESVTLAAPGQVQLVFSGKPGTNVTILQSSNVADWSVLTNLANPSGTVQFTDDSATSGAQRVYRLRTP